MRYIFYKLKLVMENGQELPITIATTDINNIQPLVEKHKIIYLARGYNVARFEIVDTKYSFNMSEAQYQEELSFCDIVDEPTTGDATGPSQLIKVFTR